MWLIKGLGLGGAEQLVKMCVPRFDRERFEIEVAYVLPHKDALVEDLRDRGITVHGLGKRNRVGWVPALRRLLRDGRYDLIHTHSPAPAAVARLLLTASDTPVVHTEHNVWERFRPSTRVTNAATFGRNAFVFGVSSGVVTSIERSRWRSLVAPPLEVLHHGIDEDAVRTGPNARETARALLGLDPTEPVIGTVANFTPKKDHETLLEGFRRLDLDGRAPRLVLVGSGPRQEELEAKARRLGIEDRVTFTGMRNDVPQILPAFDVFVLTSLHEGLPIALLEAMATGLPAVVTPVGGTREMITDGRSGYFVPCQDSERLARTLMGLLADDGLRRRMGVSAREDAGRFSITGAVRRMEVVYDRVLADVAHS